MSHDQNSIKYVKQNKVRIKVGIKREEITKILLEFFEEIREKPTGMKYCREITRRIREMFSWYQLNQ